jgi:hypothetical protein
MQVAFMIWGILGLILSLFSLIGIVFSLEVGVGTSAYVSALVLIWIGGMLFFALGAIMNLMNRAQAAADDRSKWNVPAGPTPTPVTTKVTPVTTKVDEFERFPRQDDPAPPPR